MVKADVVAFDMSFDNWNVQREREFFHRWGQPATFIRQITIDYNPRPTSGAPAEGPKYSTSYGASLYGLTSLAEDLQRSLHDALSGLGFGRGFLDPWIRCLPPPSRRRQESTHLFFARVRSFVQGDDVP